MSKKKTTVVSFLLDETGSMQSIKDDTIGGFNSYLDTLAQDGNKYEFSLVKFDSNRHEKVCVGVPISEAPRLDDQSYRPGAGTPLIDAAVKLINATAELVKKRKVNVLVVIQTDGYENASREYTSGDLLQLVKEKTAAGWTFVYIGAGIDAFGQAKEYGFAAAQTMSYGRGKSRETFISMASNTSALAASGNSKSMNFTGAQRASSGDIHHGSHTGASPKKVEARKKRSGLVEDMDLTSN